MSFTTNPYASYHAPNSKEFIALNRSALIDYKPEQQFELLPGNADAFANQLEAISKQFSYNGLVKRVPLSKIVEADGTITFGDNKSILESWNQISLEAVLQNANETWGDRTWNDVVPHEIQDLSNARGEVENGVRGDLNAQGKLVFIKRWRSRMLATHALKSLTPEAVKSLQTNQGVYEWYHPISGETAEDGLTVMAIILQKMRPNVKINVFNEISKIKRLDLSAHGGNITAWSSAMEAKRATIELKIPGAYDDDQFMMDILQGALQAKCKTFVSQVQSMKQRWLLGNPDNLTKDTLVSNLVQYYSNMVEDGTWKKEFEETDQIIALTTLVNDLQKNMARNTIALATKADPAAAGTTPTRRGKKQPYTVEAWRLVKTTDTVEVKGTTWHWCTKDHYSGGEVHNGMYAKHDCAGHDAWRKDIDDKRAKNKQGTPVPPAAATTPTTPTVPNDKKLALSESLRTALCTQAGMSADAADRLWTEVCRDSGND